MPFALKHPPATLAARRTALLLWVPMAVLLSLAALMVFSATNQAVFVAGNEVARMLPDAFWSCLTVLGDTLMMYGVLSLSARRSPRLLAAALLGGIIAGAFVHMLKPLLSVARPVAVMGAENVHVIGIVLRGNSFPSGHSTAIFLAAATLMFFNRERAAAAALWVLPLAALAAFSRVAVGAHWPLDVLAGAALGWLSGAAGEALSRRWPSCEGRAWRLIFSVLMMLVGIALLRVNLGYPLALGMQFLVALLTLLSAALAFRHALIMKKLS